MTPRFPRPPLPRAALRHSVPRAREVVAPAICRRRRATPKPSTRRALACAAACALLLALFPACRRDAPPSAAAPADPPAAAPAARDDNKKKENRPVDAHAPSKQSDQPPAPDAVLYFIYNKDGDGATSYEIENGSVATYWYGREFDLGGKHYFTGFAYNTPQRFGGSDEESYPDPDATVTLTQATFRLDRPGTQKPWRAIGAELWIGDFGGYEKADAIDASRETVSYETPGGQLVLAVPTTALQSGVSVYGYAVFRFNPGELADVEDRHWRYLGTVPAGEDNSAACDEGAVMTCASSSGMLRFVRPAQGEFPLVEVEMSGTTVGSQGEVRTLGAADKATFAYDEGKVAYVEQ